jgi:hypothetical protein
MCLGNSAGLAEEMLQLRTFEPQAQAEIWTALATSSTKPGDQLHALLRASEVLSSHPRLRVGALIPLGEWLFCNGFPTRDAEDQLLAAVDLLTEAEDDSMANEDVEIGGGDDGGSSIVSSGSIRRSRGGGSCVASSAALSTRTGGAKPAGGTDDEALTVRVSVARIPALISRPVRFPTARTGPNAQRSPRSCCRAQTTHLHHGLVPSPCSHKPAPAGKRTLERGHFSQSNCISPERARRRLIEDIEFPFRLERAQLNPRAGGLQRALGIRQSGLFLENFLNLRCILTEF